MCFRKQCFAGDESLGPVVGNTAATLPTRGCRRQVKTVESTIKSVFLRLICRRGLFTLRLPSFCRFMISRGRRSAFRGDTRMPHFSPSPHCLYHLVLRSYVPRPLISANSMFPAACANHRLSSSPLCYMLARVLDLCGCTSRVHDGYGLQKGLKPPRKHEHCTNHDFWSPSCRGP